MKLLTHDPRSRFAEAIVQRSVDPSAGEVALRWDERSAFEAGLRWGKSSLGADAFCGWIRRRAALESIVAGLLLRVPEHVMGSPFGQAKEKGEGECSGSK